MAEPSRDPKTPKTEAEKKQPETVLLTSEELRAIAGGGGIKYPAPPNPSTETVGGTHKKS